MTELTYKKRLIIQQPDWDNCLCHVVENSDGKLTAFSQKSWETFQVCANRRKDSIWIKMENAWDEGPRGSYHRRCYQEYTDKNKVATAEQDRQLSEKVSSQESDIASVASPPKRIRRSQVSSFDLEKCAICQKDKMKTKGARTRESLTLNISELGSTSLIKAAQIRNDTRLLLNINAQDTIAMEIKYHRSCYKDYVRQRELDRLEEQNCRDEDTGAEGYSKAFQKLKINVEEEIFINAKAVPMSALLDKYIKFLLDEGIVATTYRSSKLKNRLVRCFGEKLSYRKPLNRNQSEIVYNSHVDVGEVVETVVKNSTQYEEYEGEVLEENDGTTDTVVDESYQVFHAAKVIRKLLVDVKSSMKWPPTPDDLDSGSTMVPDMVYNMMAWILSPKSEYSKERVSELSPDVHRLVVSLSQDLIHCVSRGRVKTSKHVLLPMTVKSLTGSVELITILNRFGHSLSYSQVEELETALAETQIARQQNDVLIPDACSPNVPGVFCWDNNDVLEETLSGKYQGSMRKHVTTANDFAYLCIAILNRCSDQ